MLRVPLIALTIIMADTAAAEEFVLPVEGAVRRDDGYGSGGFNASRDGGARKHHGLDLLAPAGSVVRTPASGRIEKIGYCYEGNLFFRYVSIRTQEGYLIRIMYVQPDAGIVTGSKVEGGQPIGRVQPIAAHYGPPMRNHVHVEVIVNGQYVDPERLLAAK